VSIDEEAVRMMAISALSSLGQTHSTISALLDTLIKL